jgi:hypothetical protein
MPPTLFSPIAPVARPTEFCPMECEGGESDLNLISHCFVANNVF